MEGGDEKPSVEDAVAGAQNVEEENEAGVPDAAPDASCRVYVGNLAWEVAWQELKDLFEGAGLDVVRANVMLTPDGRSKGCGIVELTTPEDAQKAITTLNDTELMGRQIFVREDREGRSPAAGSLSVGGGASAGGGGQRFSSGEQSLSRRVYVGNLSWDVAWQDLKDHMRQAGEVVHAEIISEHNGRSKGCGLVEFSTEAEAQEAITTLTDTELKGRMIFVREDREGPSAGAPELGGGRSPGTSLYVWNLSYETTWQELKDHMRKAGNVDQATILTDAEGNSIGCGVVVYQRAQEAARAIRELQESELNGRVMRVREDRGTSGGRGRGGGRFSGRGRGGGRGRGRGRGRFSGGRSNFGGRGGGGGGEGRQVFVGNLSDETTWRELKDHFRQCGEVERSDVRYSSDANTPNFGIIRYFEASDAENAISTLNGVELQGSTLEVRLDHKA